MFMLWCFSIHNNEYCHKCDKMSDLGVPQSISYWWLTSDFTDTDGVPTTEKTRKPSRNITSVWWIHQEENKIKFKEITKDISLKGKPDLDCRYSDVKESNWLRENRSITWPFIWIWIDLTTNIAMCSFVIN